MFHVRLEMDMPCVGGSAVTERVKLVGGPAASTVEAVEKMSQIIIDYLHHAVDVVVVVDMHYAPMKQLEKRLSKANAFASTFFDWVVDLKQNQSDSRDRVDELFRSDRDMVIGFGDVLPVGTFEVDGLGIAPNISTLTYLGPDPSVTRCSGCCVVHEPRPAVFRHRFHLRKKAMFSLMVYNICWT
jgi:hypothetical protein